MLTWFKQWTIKKGFTRASYLWPVSIIGILTILYLYYSSLSYIIQLAVLYCIINYSLIVHGLFLSISRKILQFFGSGWSWGGIFYFIQMPLLIMEFFLIQVLKILSYSEFLSHYLNTVLYHQGPQNVDGLLILYTVFLEVLKTQRTYCSF